MKDWQLAIVLRPLLLVALFVTIVIPLEAAFIRWVPEGKLKRLLLTRW